MMWQEVAVAALVGLALSDAWLCLFMGASIAAVDRRLSWGFLVGRTLGVLALLMVIGILGTSLLPSKEWLVIFFAASTIAVAILLAWSAYRPNLFGGCAPETGVAADGGTPDGTAGCPGNCDSCSGHDAGGASVCKHMPLGLVQRLSGKNPMASGVALGAFRGAMPCLKVLIITPLLIASPPTTVVLMALAFALTSAIYPLIGMMSGNAMATFVEKGRWLRLAGAIGVASVGIYTMYRFYQQSCAGL